MDKGPPPIVFTVGSTVHTIARAFFQQSAACAKAIRRRAVFVVGKGNLHCLSSLPSDMLAVEYAPFSELFPRAAAVVHHGGIGTTGAAMRSGRPMLVVPFSWDQPDNAERVRRLGIARTIPKRCFTAKTAVAALRRLLDDPAYSRQSAGVAHRMEQEDGVSAACDAIEALLDKSTLHLNE